MESKQYVVRSVGDLSLTASVLLRDIKYPVVLLEGQLGAGKTTLIKAILQELQCEDIGSSPSYSIINQYKGIDGIIYHIDLYRINNAEEAFALGLEEILYSGRPCYIEWPQLIMDYVDDNHHKLLIEVMDNGVRQFTLM